MKTKLFFFCCTMISILIIVSQPAFSGSQLTQVRISASKAAYLEQEPIILRYTVKNISDRTIKLTFLDLPYHFKINDQNGLTYPARFSIELGFVNTDSLIPGQEYKDSVGITDLYGVVSSGEYSCYFELPQGLKEYVSPGGKSNVIKIMVKEPEGDEKKALDMLLEADKLTFSRDEQRGGRDLKRAELGFLKYQELADKYPKSVYAPLALASARGVYRYSNNLEERKKMIPVSKRLIEEYPNSIYFMSAFTSLVEVYEVSKDKAGAVNALNELIQKHPNSKISQEARRRLGQVEAWKF